MKLLRSFPDKQLKAGCLWILMSMLALSAWGASGADGSGMLSHDTWLVCLGIPEP